MVFVSQENFMRTEEKSVAIYIRVSTNDQAQDGYSLAAQEKILKAWASERHYRVADVYAVPVSAAKT